MPNMFTRIGLGMGPWFHRKIVDPLLQILRRGAEPKQLAFSAALGICLGVFPICGVTRLETRHLGKEWVIHSSCVLVPSICLMWFIWHGRNEHHFDCLKRRRRRIGSSFVSSLVAGIGVTVFLCGMAIAVLGSHCHAPTVMLANFMATPIELSLVVPFLRLGEVISGGPHFPLTSDALKKVLTGEASREVLHSILHALLGWLVAAPFILGILHLLFLPCCKILVRKFSTAPSSPKKPHSTQLVRKLSTSPSSPKKSLSSHLEVRLKVRDV